MSAELDPTLAARPSKGSAPTRRGTAHVYVRETLRQDILNGTLPGGMRLAQTDIAQQLGVSTTPVREALRDLASEGLVIIDPHRGGFVMELTSDDVFEIYEIRYQLEPVALKYALPFINEEIIERLDQLNEEMSATSHLPTWVELNRDFHMTMYGASNRSRLLSIIRSVQDGSVMAVAGRLAHKTGVREEANHEHTNLVDALRARDADRALAVLQHHLERHTHG
jgi:DNA-binding GntR family transcriptional regulator